MSSLKRASTAPPAPKPPVHFAPALVIADNAALTGTNLISIGLHTVIHPRAKLNSTYGPITIGSNCIISERSQIGFQNPPSNSHSEGVFIENGVVIETGAIVEARKVGEGSVIEVNARIGKGAILGKHCKVGALCEVQEGEIIGDFTVLYADGMRRVDGAGIEDLKLKMVGRQTEILRKLIPSNPAKFQ